MGQKGVNMKFKKIISTMLITSIFAMSLAGCSSEKETQQSNKQLDDPKWKEAMTSPFTTYPETVEYTLGRQVSNYDSLKGTKYEGDNDTNNAWTRYMKKKLNVQNENLFEANDGDDYEQKVSMAIVSGEIPDIMTVSDFQTLKQLYENDMIEDLTEVYDNCASDRIKEIYDSYEGRCLDTAKFDGKLMALPTTEIAHGPGVLWLRKDWMDKLGLQAPKTMDDVTNILKQFLEKDPGGNGKNNTVGLVMSTDVAGTSGGPYMVNNIFSLYNAFPKQWMDDGTGKAVYGSIQPGMKEALNVLADMYSEGLIDKQLAVRTTDDCKALLTSGKSGAVLDNWWGSWTIADSLTLNPDAEWAAYVCPVNEDGDVTMFTGNPNSSYIVVRKGFEHPELLMKIASMQYDYARYQDEDKESLKEITEYSKANVSGTILSTNIDYYNSFIQGGERIAEALKSGDTSKLSIFDMNGYEGNKKYLEKVKNGEKFDANEWAGYTSTIDCAKLVSDSKIKEVDPIFFGTTASMSLKWPTLSKMEQAMYLKIITGEEGIDYFDKFVSEWKKTGGDQITDEVNEELKKK